LDSTRDAGENDSFGVVIWVDRLDGPAVHCEMASDAMAGVKGGMGKAILVDVDVNAVRICASSGTVATRRRETGDRRIQPCRPSSGLEPGSDDGGLGSSRPLVEGWVDGLPRLIEGSERDRVTGRVAPSSEDPEHLPTQRRHCRASPSARSHRPTSRAGRPDSFAQARFE